MGCWWIDESPYPGPASNYEPAAKVFAAFASRVGKVSGLQMATYAKFAEHVTATMAEIRQLEFQFNLPPNDPPFEAGGFVPKPKKPSPMPTHVGPRSHRQFDRRGRRKS